jgi:hypothetical protein
MKFHAFNSIRKLQILVELISFIFYYNLFIFEVYECYILAMMIRIVLK